MNQIKPLHVQIGALLAVALAAPTAALAYGERDAIRDCESRLRSEYQISDLRDATAERLQDRLHHYKVQGLAKVDGEKYPWTCEIVNRRVAAIQYQGRRSSQGGGGTPEVVPRRSGEIEVRMPSGCTALYDRDGQLITRGSSCSQSDRRRADDAADSYFREQGRDSGRGRYEGGGAPPQLIAGSNGEAEVVFKNDCVVYYDRRGRRTNVSPKCQGSQVTKADQALRAYRREQGL